jgi:hypothetical protein
VVTTGVALETPEAGETRIAVLALLLWNAALPPQPPAASATTNSTALRIGRPYSRQDGVPLSLR